MYWTPAEHLIQLSCMAVIIFGAQAIARHAHQRRLRAETHRLRSILSLGLSSLSRTYAENLDLLSHPPRRLIAGRHQLNLLRLHLGRITSLETAEAEAVMSACIAAERAEAWLEIAAKPMGGAIAGKSVGGAAASILGGAGAANPRTDELKDSLRASMVEAIDQIQRAIEALTPPGDTHLRASTLDAPEAPASVARQPRNLSGVSAAEC